MPDAVDDHVNRLNDAIARAESWSPFLRGQMRRFPDLVDTLVDGDLHGALTASAFQPVEAADVPRALRVARGRLALALAIGDLAGLLTLDDVTGRLSAFADIAVEAAIASAVDSLAPGEEPRGLVALALGKHGGCELNYSSDIDPIFLCDPETLPRRQRDEPVEAAARLVSKVVEILQRRDGEGYVFRVDLRLRPNPEVTPTAIPIDAAISYYESSALTWERAAFIRARACAGDVALGEAFLDTIKPFIWRRSLDFGAIREIRAMSQRIRGAYAAGQLFGPGYDLKRGRGGIREIEFFAQIHQMIHGGRDPALRAPATLDALTSLSEAGRIRADEAASLAEAYRIHRTIEHRLQMVADQQTHSIPRDADALDGVAKLHGLEGGDALIALLAPHVETVATIYDGLDDERAKALPIAADALEATLAAAGFNEAPAAAQRIARWRGGALRALRTPAAHEALEAVLPALIAALGASSDPMTALNRLDSLIERLPSAINLFRLLEARPPLLKLLTDILSHAPTLAHDLSRRASLIDGLIDATALDRPGSVEAIRKRLNADGGPGTEERLDAVRRIVGELRFALGAQIVVGASDPVDVAADYAHVAEAAIAAVADAVVDEFRKAHGAVPNSEFVILALGRMGGGELTHASDLDLIYLFTGDYDAESDGPKPLGAVLYYNRLAQRVSAGLSVATAAGPLYEVDTRLRPSGNQGPLVVSLDAFERYQREDAWTWEHMALCRARPVYGSVEARAAVQAILDAELMQPRESATLLADAVKMRDDMARHKPPKGPLDVKLSDGGLVDLEFAVHVTQLRHRAGFDPHLGRAIAMLGEQGLAPATLIEAQRFLTRVLVTVRLMAPDDGLPSEQTRPLVARACGQKDWPGLLAELERVRQDVAAFWSTTKENADAR